LKKDNENNTGKKNNEDNISEFSLQHAGKGDLM
jgi:hypothetical protein